MQFLWSTLHVQNLERSLAIWGDAVALTARRRFGAKPGPLFAFWGNEGSEIELIGDGRDTQAEYGKDTSLGIEVKNLDETIALIREKGIPVLREPVQPNPMSGSSFMKDPDSLSIQFIETIP